MPNIIPEPRKAPRVWARKYTGNFLQGSLPNKQREKVTVGFMWPPAKNKRAFLNKLNGAFEMRSTQNTIKTEVYKINNQFTLLWLVWHMLIKPRPGLNFKNVNLNLFITSLSHVLGLIYVWELCFSTICHFLQVQDFTYSPNTHLFAVFLCFKC